MFMGSETRIETRVAGGVLNPVPPHSSIEGFDDVRRLARKFGRSEIRTKKSGWPGRLEPGSSGMPAHQATRPC